METKQYSPATPRAAAPIPHIKGLTEITREQIDEAKLYLSEKDGKVLEELVRRRTEAAEGRPWLGVQFTGVRFAEECFTPKINSYLYSANYTKFKKSAAVLNNDVTGLAGLARDTSKSNDAVSLSTSAGSK